MSPGGVFLFYFSGHGIVWDGMNLLPPANMKKISDPHRIKHTALVMHDVLESRYIGASDHGIKLTILDCCRDRPYEQIVTKNAHVLTKSVDFAHLSKLEISANTFQMFATSEATMAFAGDKGRLSPFTNELVQQIPTPGLEVAQLMKRVRKALVHSGAIPQENSNMIDDFFFIKKP